MSRTVSRREFVGSMVRSIVATSLAPSVGGAAKAAEADARRRHGEQLRMTNGTIDFQVPKTVPAGEVWHYGLAYPFQVSARKAGVFCNIRSRHGRDSEAGTDVILFDRLEGLNASDTVAVSRNHAEQNPNSDPPGQPALMVKYPVAGGFVPLGATRADGTPHPHAGSGFGIATAIAWKPDMIAPFQDSAYHEYLELYQCHFDGTTFQVRRREPLAFDDFLSGFGYVGRPINNAIADGDDLLFAISAAKPGELRACGITRWRKSTAGWRPIEWVPVTAKDGSYEPTLIRDSDGRLLLCARGGSGFQYDIRVWRSDDRGITWSKAVHAYGATSNAPISINSGPDGPYVASNLYEVFRGPPPEVSLRRDASGRTRLGGWLRDKLCFWPLNEQRNGLEPGIIVRDGTAEFGRAPSGVGWNIDHPSSAVVQLADGRWHNVMGMRVADTAEVWVGADPTTRTGAYLEEVVSRREPAPVWSFA